MPTDIVYSMPDDEKAALEEHIANRPNKTLQEVFNEGTRQWVRVFLEVKQARDKERIAAGVKHFLEVASPEDLATFAQMQAKYPVPGANIAPPP